MSVNAYWLIFINILIDPNVTLLTWDDVDGIWYLKGPYAFALEQNKDVKWVYNKEKGRYVLSVLVVCNFFQLCEFPTNIFTRALLVWMPLLLNLFLTRFLIYPPLVHDLSLQLHLALIMLLLSSHPWLLRHLKNLKV